MYHQIDRSAADLIMEIDGTPVTKLDEFLDYIDRKKPGDVVDVTVLRENESVIIPIELGGE